jgi:hypothetical protein
MGPSLILFLGVFIPFFFLLKTLFLVYAFLADHSAAHRFSLSRIASVRALIVGRYERQHRIVYHSYFYLSFSFFFFCSSPHLRRVESWRRQISFLLGEKAVGHRGNKLQ